MSTKLKWFGVKGLIRIEAFGPVHGRDASYDPDGTLVEERIMVVRARDPKDAASRTRNRLAKEKVRYSNSYGQEVRSRLLEGMIVYELFDPPADNMEVFSDTHRVPTSLRDAEVAKRFSSAELSDRAQRKRFIAAEVADLMDSMRKSRKRNTV
jgi:hypothetical protein